MKRKPAIKTQKINSSLMYLRDGTFLGGKPAKKLLELIIKEVEEKNIGSAIGHLHKLTSICEDALCELYTALGAEQQKMRK